MSIEEQVSKPIYDWENAVKLRNLEEIVAHHSLGISQFDVPPRLK